LRFHSRSAGRWPKERAAGTLILDFDARHRSRIRLTADQGEHVLLDVPEAVAMADGDGLQLEHGRWLKIQAAAELIAEVRHKDPNRLMRLAWRLGNRHLPTEIPSQVLRIGPTSFEDMLHGFVADLVKVQARSSPKVALTAARATITTILTVGIIMSDKRAVSCRWRS
jgi:urease accessory protein